MHKKEHPHQLGMSFPVAGGEAVAFMQEFVFQKNKMRRMNIITTKRKLKGAILLVFRSGGVWACLLRVKKKSVLRHTFEIDH